MMVQFYALKPATECRFRRATMPGSMGTNHVSSSISLVSEITQKNNNLETTLNEEEKARIRSGLFHFSQIPWAQAPRGVSEKRLGALPLALLRIQVAYA